ncbi:MAG: DEAD/DEAH box helicase family protein, partial [Actinobacteria bacterium]|nr:DEAD/DEAH box helicase family protein [Actinomycetota bacterium]
MTARPCSLGIRSNVRHDPSAIRLTRRPLAPSGTIGMSAAELCTSLVTASSSRTPGRRRLAALQRANKPKLSIDSSWFVATLLLVTQAALAPFSTLAFRGTWRGYQELALAAFEADRASSNRQTYIVAPPGSGKTLLGMEIIRRLGARALVLVPNTAVQAQWLRTAGSFGAPEGFAAADPAAVLACLTYQALCQLDDPAAAVRAEAERRWATDRARATGGPTDKAERAAAGWTGEAAARREREIARIMAAVKREIAKNPDGPGLAQLLSHGARGRIDQLRANGVQVIVLDECHHLASMWGYVVRAALAQLPGAHVVGLTATPPDELTTEENELYTGLLGPVDFTVPTPALVRDRALAPYQELAWLTRPLESETAWLAEHDLRFTELITSLHAESDDVPSLPAWVITRLRDRGRSPDEEAEVPWPRFQRAHPSLARAGARFLSSGGLELPPGVPRSEGYREKPDFDDWLVLLEDYSLKCLAADPSPAAASRYTAIATALRALGFSLTRQGIRRGTSDVDRLLTNSAAKTLALADVLSCEFEQRGPMLRALLLTDTEQAATPGRGLGEVLAADAGSAPAALRALAADPRTSALRPLLVTGRGLQCSATDADVLLDALRRAAGNSVDGWLASPADGGDDSSSVSLVRLNAAGPAWQSRLWVALATSIFSAGSTRVLIGTRAMLGEGWDAPCVNCLVDLSTATTAVSVQQSRGRALRLDPADPDKIASNWDVVCVAPELPRGIGDYQRFVRKHAHVLAPAEDGAIEAGPSHVHPALGPFAPPSDAEFAQINRAMSDRTADQEQAFQRWRIGEPYQGTLQQTLVIQPRGPAPSGQLPVQRLATSPPSYPIRLAYPGWLAGAGTAASLLALAATSHAAALGGLALLPVSACWAALRLAWTRSRLANALPLDLVAQTICECYVRLGEMTAEAAASLAIEPRSAGYLRCFLASATPAESETF